MSSSAAAVKLPIQLFGLEGRYATALYTAATKMNQLDSVEKELTQVRAAIRQKPKLREAISSPIINRKLLETTLASFGKAANLSSATTNLLVLLAENGRLRKIDGVISAFKTIMAAHRGEVVCEVKTARALSDAQRKELHAALGVSETFFCVQYSAQYVNQRYIQFQKFVKSNQTILLNEVVDPSIIGGMVASIGDKYVDMSVASKIKKYKDLISSAA